MKKNITKWLHSFIFLLCSVCILSFPAFGAEIEGSYGTTDRGVYGWAWHKGHFGDILNVKILLYYDDMSSPKKALSLTADKYNKNVEDTIGDGWHYFETAVDWDALGGKPKKIKVYAVYNEQWIGIGATATGGSLSSSSMVASSQPAEKSSSGSTSAGKSSSGNVSPAGTSGKKGKSLGEFSISGYCTCPDCIIGQGLTCSGKKPTGNHTIAADLNLFPLGTKLWIDGVIYTVEDTGSGIVGNKLDIYFDTHQTAASFGRKTKEVFEVTE